MKWVKLILGLAGLGVTLWLALRPNPLRDALVELIKAVSELIGRGL